MDRPLAKYTIEECSKMTHEEFEAILEADNEWVRRHYSKLNESDNNEEFHNFNSIEELRAYFHCKPLSEIINKGSEMFGI